MTMLRDAMELHHASPDRRKLHELFAESLVWCDVADPVRLWSQYVDLLRRQRDVNKDATLSGMSDEHIQLEAYAALDEVLQSYQMHPDHFGIVAPSPSAVDPRRAFREYASELRDAAGQAREKQLCDELVSQGAQVI